MKFMMNGALILGTMDRANVDIYEQVEDEHMFLVGLTKEEIEMQSKEHTYHPMNTLKENKDLLNIINNLVYGQFFKSNYEVFKEIHDNLLYGSWGYCG